MIKKETKREEEEEMLLFFLPFFFKITASFIKHEEFISRLLLSRKIIVPKNVSHVQHLSQSLQILSASFKL